MEELIKESCFRGYHFYSSIYDAEIGEQVHARVFESHYNDQDWYAVVVVKDGVVVRLSFKALSRIPAELHVLSKGIIIQLILSFEKYSLINFRGFIDPQKFFETWKKFPDYGNVKFVVYWKETHRALYVEVCMWLAYSCFCDVQM